MTEQLKPAVSQLAQELKQPPRPIFTSDDLDALRFNLHDPKATRAAFDSIYPWWKRVFCKSNMKGERT